MKRSIILVMVLLLISCCGYAGYIEDGTYEDILPCEEYIGGEIWETTPPSPVLETLQIGNMAYLDIYRDGSGVIKGSNTLYSSASISSILEEAGYDNYITSLEVGENILPVSGLGGSCFLPFGNKLESIHLTSSVLNNAQMLFASLTTVKTITIDAAMSEIPNDFCIACSALETISIPNWTGGVVSGFAFQGTPNLQTFIQASEYGTQAYYQSGIESVVLPSGCRLGQTAFASCHNLTSLNCQGDTSTNTGSAFSDTSLAEITVYATGSPVIWTVDSDKVITADDASKAAYPNLCQTLTSSGYTFFDPVSRNLAYTLASDGTGYYVSGLGSHTADLVINVPAEHNSLPVLGTLPNASACPFGMSTVFKEFNFLGDITVLGQYAFTGCTNLERVTGINSVTTIGKNCFQNCSQLRDFAIPETIQNIGDYAFDIRSPYITTLTIPEHVVSIGQSPVINMSNLVEMNILCPPSVTNKTIIEDCPQAVIKLNVKYFLDWIYAPNGYDSEDSDTGFAKDYVDIQLINYSSGFLLDSDNKIKTILNHTSDEIYVPAVVDGRTVTGIKNGALRKNGITKILIDNSNALDIEDYAIGNPSLSEIIFTGNIPPTIASHSFVASVTATTFFPYYSDYKDTNRADIQVNTAWVNLYKDSLAAPVGGYHKMLGYGGYKHFYSQAAYSDGFKLYYRVTPQRQYYWIAPSWNRKPVRMIGDDAKSNISGWFAGTCTTIIKKVFFPEGIVTIGGVLFQANSNMEAPMMPWPESLTSFNSASQYDRTHVSSFAFPQRIHTIPDYFCTSCASLTAVVIPAHITRIGNQSFGRLQKTGSWPNSGIKEITFEGVPPATIHADAFYSVTDATIYYPSEYSSEWSAYTGSTSFKGATNVTWVAQ